MGRGGRRENWVRNRLEEIAAVAPVEPVLDRPDQWHPYPAPEVKAEFSRPGPSRIGWNRKPLRVVEGRPALSSFLRLADADDDKVLRFAQQWGVLGICAHGIPMLHGGQCQPLRWVDRVWLPNEVRSCPPEDDSCHDFWEPTASWRFLAREFTAVLAIAAAASAGRAPDPRHIADTLPPRLGATILGVQLGTAFAPPSPGDVQRVEAYLEAYWAGNRPLFGRLTVTTALKRLVQEAGLGLDFLWRENEPAPRVTLSLGDGLARLPNPTPRDFPFACTGALFPFLVTGLVAAAQRADGIVDCAKCGGLIESPTGRKLRRDGTHFCDECRPDANRERWAAHKRRQRHRGRSIAVVADAPRMCAHLGCTKSLPTNHARAKFCSNSCRVRDWQERQKTSRTPTPLNKLE